MGTNEQLKQEDEEILDFSLIEQSSADEEKVKKDQPNKIEFPINVRLDLAEQIQRRSKSARMKSKMQPSRPITIMDGFS